MKTNWPMLATVLTIRQLYGPARIRVRQWGALPARRGPAVLITNHQHEDEGETVVRRMFLLHPWKPLVVVNSRRTFERGFFAARFPRTAPFLRNFNPSGFFECLSVLPVENMLFSRPLTSLADEILAGCGDVMLDDVLPDDVLGELGLAGRHVSELWSSAKLFAAGQTRVKLSQLRQPYRKYALDTFRLTAARDIEAIVQRVREGATFYVTPEGDYSRTGRLHPLRRGIVDAVLPVADAWLCAIAYDPFRGRRLSMLYRVLRPADLNDLDASLAAARPVTTSALLSSFLLERVEPFACDDAVRGVKAGLRAIPENVFVDPELRDTGAVVREALAKLVKRGTLVLEGEYYRLTDRRADPRFPHLDDMLTFQRNMLDETLEAAAQLAAGPGADAPTPTP
jgi:hypothetical protein